MPDMQKAGPGEKEQRGIQSVEIGFRLIEILAASRGKMPLKALASAAGMTSSKAHPYLASFQRVGMVAKDPASGRYGLGPAAIRYGLAGINQLGVVDVAREPMEELQEKTGLSITLTIWGNHGPTIIQKLDSEMPVPLMVRVGYVLPLLSSASGRIFLAHLPHLEWAPVAMREIGFDRSKLESTEKLIEEVRRAGVAVSNSLLNQGFFGISAPVFDHGGRIAAAVTVLGLRGEIDITATGAVAQAVRETGRHISVALGYVEQENGLEPSPKGKE